MDGDQYADDLKRHSSHGQVHRSDGHDSDHEEIRRRQEHECSAGARHEETGRELTPPDGATAGRNGRVEQESARAADVLRASARKRCDDDGRHGKADGGDQVETAGAWKPDGGSEIATRSEEKRSRYRRRASTLQRSLP